MFTGLQFITHEDTAFYLPDGFDGLPNVDNHVPLPSLPKIRLHSAPSSVLTIERNGLFLRTLHLYCKGQPPPWQDAFPRSVLTDGGWSWFYEVRISLRHTGVAIGYTEKAVAAFAFREGRLLDFKCDEREGDEMIPGSSALS